MLSLSAARDYDQRRPACTGDDPELWFPYPSQDFAYARMVCGMCPLRLDCREFARRTHQTGVWGGVEFDRGRLVRE
ncbi:WhiB family transcriptional regulator [Nocardia transvalensis]|uniref:WhiB family transcriptional regulator n=1 Tax=Nocardia transvalensis TaxID=37333 RepID=UPI001E3D9D16|nr:WhiB family transcriptional regulator [Nocardia transvalensis]